MSHKKELDICVFYFCVHKRCNEKVGMNRIMTKNHYFKMLGETYHIPKVLRIIILKEMAKLQMLKEIDHRYIEVLPLLIDPEININEFYKRSGLF